MLKYMFITDQVDVAQYVLNAGVDRIFFDLEILGKKERQGHLDTVISAHNLRDLPAIRAAIGDTELLVRVNPIHDGTVKEVETAIHCGADLLMLPMFKYTEELQEFIQVVQERAKVVALIETPEAFNSLKDIVLIPGINEIYIGLNDLSLASGSTFMFEPLVDGRLENAIQHIKRANIPFGFGGIARVGEGLLPAELLLAEHVRLGSDSVILSRTFTRKANSLSELKQFTDVDYEIKCLREMESKYQRRTQDEIDADKMKVKAIINSIVNK